MGRGHGDAPNRVSINWYGGDKNGMSKQKNGSGGVNELWTEAREMRLFEGRFIGMGGGKWYDKKEK